MPQLLKCLTKLTLLGIAAVMAQVQFKANSVGMSKWVQVAQADTSQMHEMIFSVQKRNLDKLEEALYAVSTPGSPQYGQHWTRQQVADLTSNPSSTAALISYLKLQPKVTITSQDRWGDYVTASAPISVWQDLLATQFFNFSNPQTSSADLVRTDGYTLPSALVGHVAYIFHAIDFPNHKSTLKKSRFGMKSLAGGMPQSAPPIRDNGFVTPALLNSYYSISNNVGSSKTSQAVYESINQNFSPQDLAGFQSNFALQNNPVSSDIGGFNSDATCLSNQNDCMEANLDIQYLLSISGAPTSSTYWYDTTNGGNGDFVTWLTTQVAASPNPPHVISISYGEPEVYLSVQYMQEWDNAAMTLGVMGVSIFASSGDQGVAGSYGEYNGGTCGYYPEFPASSKYVTAVGATMGPEKGSPEVVCSTGTVLNQASAITSGGGFSTLENQPTYQTAAVSKYLSTVSPQPRSGYNAPGRAYPDISALGNNYWIEVGGQWEAVCGTSASSPVVAGMVALINAALMEAGKSRVGFMNPALYAMGALSNNVTYYNDITSGENNCYYNSQQTHIINCQQGFHAAEGWDPATGWGSPKFDRFYEYFLNVVPPQSHSSPLSTGAIAGISVGSAAFFIGASITAVWYILRCRAVAVRVASGAHTVGAVAVNVTEVRVGYP